MQPEYFKLQTPLRASDPGPCVLIYNRKRTIYTEISSLLAHQLITELGMKPVGDKVYVQAVVQGGNFIANKDTLTREPEKIGIDW